MKQFLYLTSDNLTYGEKRKMKIHTTFQWQRPITLLPTLNICYIFPCLLDFFQITASLGSTIVAVGFIEEQIFYETLFLIKSKSSWIRGLNSILPFQIPVINHVIFSPVFIFQTRFACPLTQWPSTLTEVIHLVGQFIMERKHGVNNDCLWPNWEDLQ